MRLRWIDFEFNVAPQTWIKHHDLDAILEPPTTGRDTT